MGREFFGLLLAAALVAGCLGEGAGPPEAPVPIVAPPPVGWEPAASWKDTAARLRVPEGDSFGILRWKYAPETASEFLGAPMYGFTATLAEGPPGSFFSLTAFEVDEGELRWKASAYGFPGSVVGVGVDAEGERELLLALAFHVPGGSATFLGASVVSFPPALPAGDREGRWAAEGPAEVSMYRLASSQGLRVEEPLAHNVEVEAPAPGNSLVAPPSLVVRTDHGAGTTVSFSIVAGAAGAGLVDLHWKTSAGPQDVRGAWASLGLAGSHAGHVGVGEEGQGSGLEIAVRGGNVLPSLVVHHATMDLDLVGMGLQAPPSFRSIGLVLDGDSWGACARAAGAWCHVGG
jgi:hypothetical protein